jgi:hypothetical protein
VAFGDTSLGFNANHDTAIYFTEESGHDSPEKSKDYDDFAELDAASEYGNYSGGTSMIGCRRVQTASVWGDDDDAAEESFTSLHGGFEPL